MKIKDLHTVSQIASRDWLILQNAIPRLVSSISQIPEPAQLAEIEIDDFFELRPESKMDDANIAEIHVHNALVDTCPAIYEKLGMVTRYETIRSEIDSAIESGAEGIMFVMDSPGGTVSGNVELSQYVMELAVPTVTFARGLCCSAAYKIAAGTDKIIASPSASVGNIGTILSWVNMEEFWASMGVRFEALTSEGADLKSTFHTEPNETQRQFLQDGIDESGRQFRDHVIAGRAAAGKEVDDEVWRAGWYSGEKAGSLGLVDGIGSIELAREELLNLIDKKNQL